MSKPAKEALRHNERVHQVLETEADKWMKMHRLDNDIRDEKNEATKAQLKVERAKLKLQLHQRINSLYQMPLYADEIDLILKFPGLRQEFKGPGFDVFTTGRTVEVR